MTNHDAALACDCKPNASDQCPVGKEARGVSVMAARHLPRHWSEGYLPTLLEEVYHQSLALVFQDT